MVLIDFDRAAELWALVPTPAVLLIVLGLLLCAAGGFVGDRVRRG